MFDVFATAQKALAVAKRAIDELLIESPDATPDDWLADLPWQELEAGLDAVMPKRIEGQELLDILASRPELAKEIEDVVWTSLKWEACALVSDDVNGYAVEKGMLAPRPERAVIQYS